MLILRLIASVTLLLTLTLVSPTAATAKEACWSEIDVDEYGKVTSTIVCDDDGQEGEGLSADKRVCMRGNDVVPCKSDQGSLVLAGAVLHQRGQPASALHRSKLAGPHVGEPVLLPDLGPARWRAIHHLVCRLGAAA